MARSKNTKSGTRDALQSLPLAVRSRLPIGNRLALIQDLRSFSFEPATRPARLFTGAVSSVWAEPAPIKKRGRSSVPYQIAFRAPAETLVCVRRSRRKQVLFAFKKTGKRGQRKPRRSKWSSIKCGAR